MRFCYKSNRGSDGNQCAQKKTSLQNPILVQSVLFSLCSRPLGLRGEGGGVSPLFTLWKFCVTSQVDPVSILLTVRAQGMAMSPVFCQLQCYLNLENVFCHHKKITRPCLNYRWHPLGCFIIAGYCIFCPVLQTLYGIIAMPIWTIPACTTPISLSRLQKLGRNSAQSSSWYHNCLPAGSPKKRCHRWHHRTTSRFYFNGTLARRLGVVSALADLQRQLVLTTGINQKLLTGWEWGVESRTAWGQWGLFTSFIQNLLLIPGWKGKIGTKQYLPPGLSTQWHMLEIPVLILGSHVTKGQSDQ